MSHGTTGSLFPIKVHLGSFVQRLAKLIFLRVSSDTGWPIMANRILSRVSGLRGFRLLIEDFLTA